MFWGLPGSRTSSSTTSPMPLPRGYRVGGLRGPLLLPARPAVPWRPLHPTWAQGGDGVRAVPPVVPLLRPRLPGFRPVPRLTAPAAAARVQGADDARVRALNFFGLVLQEFSGHFQLGDVIAAAEEPFSAQS